MGVFDVALDFIEASDGESVDGLYHNIVQRKSGNDEPGTVLNTVPWTPTTKREAHQTLVTLRHINREEHCVLRVGGARGRRKACSATCAHRADGIRTTSRNARDVEFCFSLALRLHVPWIL